MHLIDSNLWLYVLMPDAEGQKRHRAADILRMGESAVSTQIVNEVCVNLRRKASFEEQLIERVIHAIYRRSIVLPVDKACMLKACELRTRFSFSFWDSLIVAAALLAGCSTLYSVGMQHGLCLEGVLTIQNPFQS